MCKQEGIVQLPDALDGDPIRRLIVERDEDTITIESKGTTLLTVGQRVVDGDLVSKGQPIGACGEIEKINGNKVTLRLGRPYMVSPDSVRF